MSDLYPHSPELIAQNLLAENKRVLLFGAGGSGKSTLALNLARILAGSGRLCFCIGADPGSPAFGVPGAVCSAEWRDDAWQLDNMEALCTLDSGRFRLPLVSAVRHLAAEIPNEMLLIDAPGVVRSVAGAELLAGLVEAAAVTLILALCRTPEKVPLMNELKNFNCPVVFVQAAPEARPSGKKKRALHRTGLWNAYLLSAIEKNIAATESMLTGTPPPLGAADSWCGRQVGLLKGKHTIAMGEVLEAANDTFRILMPDPEETPDQIICRDAGRNSQGHLSTLRPPVSGNTFHRLPPDVTPYITPEKSSGYLPTVRIGDATAVLVNGVFGDPLLHLRLHNRKRSILFDLGEGARLSARLAHQVSEIFISHAHFDHIGGFLWLLRSRIGEHPPCNLFGPPGLADHIQGLISGIHWDRIGDWGPRFTVREFHGGHLKVYSLQAGCQKKKRLDDRPAPDGYLFTDPECTLHTVKLEHGNIPVLAYSLEFPTKFNVKKNELSALNLPSGPWLGELKKKIMAGEQQARITLPDNSTLRAGDLAGELLEVTPPQKLVYATDLSDNSSNREKLVGLARGAHTFFCEAPFLAGDRKYAELNGHLTTRSCGEIGLAAGVEKLIPFHFSRRYQHRLSEIYSELQLFCGPILHPFLAAAAKER